MKGLKINFKENKNLTVIFILSFLGLLVALYLLYAYASPKPISCATDCELVRQSKYSKLLGIDIPVFGILYYVWVCLYCIYNLCIKEKNLVLDFIFGVSITGAFFFSVYLTYLEAYVIEAWCQWCIISAIISTIIFLLAIFDQIKKANLSTTIKA